MHDTSLAAQPAPAEWVRRGQHALTPESTNTCIWCRPYGADLELQGTHPRGTCAWGKGRGSSYTGWKGKQETFPALHHGHDEFGIMVACGAFELGDPAAMWSSRAVSIAVRFHQEAWEKNVGP
eukprot:352932-Chlamydomonas_euryale.AAC.3